MSDFFLTTQLNSPQQAAVQHVEGPLLVLAGAGSGKTRVLTHRVAYLIAKEKVRPDQILALTFTNKAAAEMRYRVDELLGTLPGAASKVVISTFHSLGARLLRQYAPRAGLDWNFSIYDDSDQRRLIGSVLQELGRDKSSSEIRARQAYIDAQKNRSATPKEAMTRAFDARAEDEALFYQAYQEALRKAGAVDFGDLILATNVLFRDDTTLASRLSNHWLYVMVDEFQDTNPAQYELLTHLTCAHTNLMVVGDDDQAIYGWRGADPTHILGFESAFQEAKVIKLEQNYRSTELILAAANDVIAHNDHRHPKELWTESRGGEPLLLFTGSDDREEAAYVAESIFDLLRQGVDPEEIAIFYRANAQGRSFEEQLRQWGVDYRIIGGLSFYAREEIKDLLSYLRAALNPNDDVATARIINTPRRGIGDATVDKLRVALQIDGVDNLQDAIALIDPSDAPSLQNDLFFNGPRPRGPGQAKAYQDLQELRGVSRKGLLSFLDLLETIRADLESQESLVPLFQNLLDRTEYLEYIANADRERAEDRLRNIGELMNALGEFEEDPGTPAILEALQEGLPEDVDPLHLRRASLLLRGFLDRSTLVQSTNTDEEGPDGRAVTMMTIHGSKGLEFDHVFLVGLEEETFPSLRNGEDPDQLAEERRLAYVAITRARERLVLTNARRRRTYGQTRSTRPSRFLLDLSTERILIDPRSVSQNIDFAGSSRYSPASSHDFSSPKSTFDDLLDQRGGHRDLLNQTSPSDWEDPLFLDEVDDLLHTRPKASGEDHLIGSTVSHSKFGIGEVVEVSGNGDKALLSIDFASAGRQTIYRRFVKILG